MLAGTTAPPRTGCSADPPHATAPAQAESPPGPGTRRPSPSSSREPGARGRHLPAPLAGLKSPISPPRGDERWTGAERKPKHGGGGGSPTQKTLRATGCESCLSSYKTPDTCDLAPDTVLRMDSHLLQDFGAAPGNSSTLSSLPKKKPRRASVVTTAAAIDAGGPQERGQRGPGAVRTRMRPQPDPPQPAQVSARTGHRRLSTHSHCVLTGVRKNAPPRCKMEA